VTGSGFRKWDRDSGVVLGEEEDEALGLGEIGWENGEVRGKKTSDRVARTVR